MSTVVTVSKLLKAL
uniref:Uncharacterized protein n=1 Tax=Rhizophora mucronata TaxID=61149 RepID=A0A2P2P560_RHIMU